MSAVTTVEKDSTPQSLWARIKAWWATAAAPSPPRLKDVGKVTVDVTFDTRQVLTVSFTGWWSTIEDWVLGEDATEEARKWIHAQTPIDLGDGKHLPRHRVLEYKLGERTEYLRERRGPR